MSPHFEKLFTIELSPKYYFQAQWRFMDRENIKVLNGDSAALMSPVCAQLDKPTFFWLDGHYSSGDTAQGSKDCPLLEEVGAIVDACRPACIVVIDDVRLFGKKGGEDWSDISVEAILRRVASRLTSFDFFPSSHHPQDRMVLHLKERD